jgi:hypothetical protein
MDLITFTARFLDNGFGGVILGSFFFDFLGDDFA